MKKETFYQGGIIVLLILFIIFVVKSHESYMDLLEVNESYESLIDKQREDSDKIISDWEKSYDDLQSEYGQLLVENEKLKDQMKEVELPTYDFTEAEVYLNCSMCRSRSRRRELSSTTVYNTGYS